MTDAREQAYDARVRAADACGHVERYGLTRRRRRVDVCLSCGEVRIDGRRSAVARPPRDQDEAKRVVEAWPV